MAKTGRQLDREIAEPLQRQHSYKHSGRLRSQTNSFFHRFSRHPKHSPATGSLRPTDLSINHARPRANVSDAAARVVSRVSFIKATPVVFNEQFKCAGRRDAGDHGDAFGVRVTTDIA